MTALRLKDAVSNMSTENEMRSTAYELIRSKSFILGKRKLSSGKESNHYFDMKRSMLDPRGANILASLIFDLLPDTRIDYVGGLELGAVPLIGPLVMLSYNKGRPIPGLIVRKKPKEHGTERLVEGADDLRGKNVVVVDDVTTTGGSAMKSIKALQAEGANVVLIISILDREEGATELYEREGLAFNPLFKASQFLNAR
ncbi:MAG: orotate phosphoribosyltransferase [Nitrospiraceae bacterium]|nr:orotate phosphoribosyltransferase [Nitrospiraceae bacterium]